MAEPRLHSNILNPWAWCFPIALAALAQAQDGPECAPPPVMLPITNVSLAPNVVRRGVAMSVGQPEQELSFLPTWSTSNIFLYGPECETDESEESCITYRGGLYNSEDSDSSGEVDSDFEWPDEIFPSSSYGMATENVTLADDLSLEDFPIASVLDDLEWDLDGYQPQHLLGLASDSTILDTLYQRGQIASRSWGMYWGLDGRGDGGQSEGSLVLGGYDRAKTYGDGYTRDMDDGDGDCPSSIVVTIRDIVLNLSNGTDVSLIPQTGGNLGFQACVEPSRPVFMRLPVDPYFHAWEDALGYDLEHGRSQGIDLQNILLSGDDDTGFDGDITLDFGSDFTLKFTNDQIVVPERSIDQDGVIVANDSQPVLRVDTTHRGNALPMLGRYFLSQAYLVGHLDTQQFTLWQANPTNTEELTALDEENNIIDSDSICSSRPEQVLTSEEEEDDDGDDGGGVGLSSGGIAGVVVGVVVAVAAVAGVFWRWRKRKTAERVSERTELGDAEQKPPTYDFVGSNQGYPHYIPQELSGNSRSVSREPPSESREPLSELAA